MIIVLWLIWFQSEYPFFFIIRHNKNTIYNRIFNFKLFSYTFLKELNPIIANDIICLY